MNQNEIKHLLILTPGFPGNEQETTCLPAVQNFVSCFRQLYPSVRLSVISMHYPYTSKSYRWQKVDIFPMDGRNKGGIHTAKTGFKTLFRAMALHRKNNIDCILSFWLTDSAFAGKYIGKLLRIPHFIWMHGQDAKPGNKYYQRVRPRQGQLAAISAFQSDVFMKAYGMRPGFIINNGIDSTKFPPLNATTRDIDLLAVGSLHRLKRYHLFIDLVKWVKDEGHPHIRAVLAGGGVLKPELEELVEKYGLGNNIKLLGITPHKDVLDLMNRAKLFIHTSEYEGHSGVLLESLYSGCKVLSFIPADAVPLENFTLCRDFAEMKKHAIDLLSSDLQFTRGKAYNMQASAKQVHDIIQSMRT